MDFIKRYKLDSLLLPCIGIAAFLLLWVVIAGRMTVTKSVDDFGDPVVKTTRTGISADLPTPVETWNSSKLYITQPFAKRGELDQGILAFAKLSLILVMQGYLIALLIGTPIGFFLGLSKTFTKAMDPIIQVLRPVSPLAWFPLGLILFSSVKLLDGSGKTVFGASDAAALFTIAICAMWPTVMNTAVGVRAVPTDYLNVAKVLKLSRSKTLFKVLAARNAALHVHGFPPFARHRVARHRRRGNAHRTPGRRRLPVAGIQREPLRADHPLHPVHRHHRPAP